MLIDALTKTNIVEIAIARIKEFEPPEGYYVLDVSREIEEKD